jgi:hypothetical protein
MELITRLGQIKNANLSELQQLCSEYRRWMFPSNGYASQRYEVHIRRFVRLPTKDRSVQIELISQKLGGKYIKHFRDIERIEALGDRLLPGFHQGILMYYPEGAKMKRHRDHPIYAKGAAQVNVSGRAILNIDGTDYSLSSGQCVKFDNTLPHSVEALTERWCICFFKLKSKHLV